MNRIVRDQQHQPGTALAGPPTWVLLRRFMRAQEAGLVLVIAVMMIGLTLAAPTISRPDGAGGTEQVDRFLNARNLVGVMTDASFIAVLAIGTMGIIIAGGIDLSIGSVYFLAALLGAMALKALQAQWLNVPMSGDVPSAGGAPLWAALPVLLVVCCGVGALCGLVNGIGTVGLAVHPFIITLGGMAAYRGLGFVLSGGQPQSTVPESLIGGFFRLPIGGFQFVPMLFMIALTAAAAFVLSRTVFGRRTYAIGGNETAARYAGVPVKSVKIWLFVLGGAAAGLSAAMTVGNYGGVALNDGQGYELRAIAAAVVGGVSLSGGRGSALGVMLGAVVIQLISNAIVVLGIDANYTNIVIGLAIVLAVVVDQLKTRFSGRR